MSAPAQIAVASNAGLAVEDLSVQRAQQPIVSRVTFSVAAGEIVAVLGANGAGKTTLLEAIVGAVRARSGAVRFNGRELATLGERSRVFSYLSDAADPPAEASVSALVGLAQRSGQLPIAEAEPLAERLGLGALTGARAGELSRGEKRRLSLYNALCTTRPVVVLDEPLGTFDPLQLLDVLEVLRDRARAGVALLLSVHQMSDAEKIASRVVILDRGRIIAVAALPELRARVGLPEASLEQVFLRLLQERRARS